MGRAIDAARAVRCRQAARFSTCCRGCVVDERRRLVARLVTAPASNQAHHHRSHTATQNLARASIVPASR